MDERPWAERVAAISALDEPVRRALYDYVSRSDAAVGRDAAAEALDLSRSTAAFHLDRLADEGLLTVEFQRLTGRTGPGSGRPAKLYRRAADEVAVSLPARLYRFAAELLLKAFEESTTTGKPAQDSLRRVAAETGHRMGTTARSLRRALEQHGFEPRPDGAGGLVLGNCPFHRLAEQHTEIVCGLNLELLRGVAEGTGDRRHTMVLEPADGRCCVRALRTK
ncbi:MAG: helix-turn-helix transcriptional regulator [Nocardioidaceae bacterium]